MKNIVSGTYYIIAAPDGRVLEVADFDHNNGAAVQLWKNEGADSQMWLAEEIVPDTFRLVNKLTGKALDIIDAGVNDGAWLHQRDYLGAYKQHSL
ncbi:MAG: RICIN domain-containing protein [Ruthenibacterium sp.]